MVDQWRRQKKMFTEARRARAERGIFLLDIVTLIMSGTERVIVGILPSSLLVIAIFATCAGSMYGHVPMTAKFLTRQSPRLP